MSLRELPKVELHCHLDGALRPATILELARERGVKLPAGNVEALRPFVQVHGPCALSECLAVFERIYPLLKDDAALERVAYELVEDSAGDNIRHLEVRFAPALNAAPGFSTDDAVLAVLRGLERGRKEFGVTSGVLVCLLLGHGNDENRAAFDTLKRFWRPSNGVARPGVVGLDLAGDASRFDARAYAPYFEEARALGIPATCHAGEVPGPATLEFALDAGARRIGHGTALDGQEKLLRRVVDAKVAIELNLTSNVRTKSVARIEDHPARRFYQAGAKVSVNTDDRGLFGIDLTHEYEEARRAGFTTDELTRISLESVDQLFLPDADRASVRARFAAPGTQGSGASFRAAEVGS
ncbi:MAG: adenosine deaminase [Elusimicrobia bacterium]|nr:adenosine deaminase [Elusimicrobiota bacterium]